MAETAIGHGHLDQKDDADFDFDLDGGVSTTSHTAGDDFDLEFDDHPSIAIHGEYNLAVDDEETDFTGNTTNPVETDESIDLAIDTAHPTEAVDEIEYEEQEIDVEIHNDEHADSAGRAESKGAKPATMEADEISYEDEDDKSLADSGSEPNVASISENAGFTDDNGEFGYDELPDDELGNHHSADDDHEGEAPQEEATIYFDAVANTDSADGGQGHVDEHAHGFADNGPSGVSDDGVLAHPAQPQAANDDNRGHGVALQPEVKVIYQQEEYSLFPSRQNHDPNSYFLSNSKITEDTLSRLLASLRDVISNEVSINEEIILRVDELGLEFGETMTKDFLDKVTLSQILEVHDKLVKNDNPDSSQPLYIYLMTRPNCTVRLADLIDDANSGKGLSQLARYYESGPAAAHADSPGEESGPQDETPGDDVYSEDDAIGAAEDEDAEEMSHAIETVSARASPSASQKNTEVHVGVNTQSEADYSSFELTGDGDLYSEENHAHGGEWDAAHDIGAQAKPTLSVSHAHENMEGVMATTFDLDVENTTSVSAEVPIHSDDINKDLEADLFNLEDNEDGNGNGKAGQVAHGDEDSEFDGAAENNPEVHDAGSINEEGFGEGLEEDEIHYLEDNGIPDDLPQVHNLDDMEGSTSKVVHQEPTDNAGMLREAQQQEDDFDTEEAEPIDSGYDDRAADFSNEGPIGFPGTQQVSGDEIDWDNDDAATATNLLTGSGIGEKRPRDTEADSNGAGEENESKRRRA